MRQLAAVVLLSALADRHPATCVSWDDAQAYASWLSRTTEALYRLPTPDDLTAAAPLTDRLPRLLDAL